MAEAAAKTGRKRDPIWTEFKRLPGNKAKCRHCEQPEIISGVAHRMRFHYLKYHQQRKKHSIKNHSLTKTSSEHSDVSKLAKSEKKTINQAIEKFFIDCKIPADKAKHESFINMTKALHPSYKIPDGFEESLNYQEMLKSIIHYNGSDFVTSSIEIEYNCQHLPEKFTIKPLSRWTFAQGNLNLTVETPCQVRGKTNFQVIFDACLENKIFTQTTEDAPLTGVLTKQLDRPPQLHKQTLPLPPVYEYCCQQEVMNQIHVELQKSDLFRSIQHHAGNNFLQFSIDEQVNFVNENFSGIDRDLTGPFAINCGRAKNLLDSLTSSISLMKHDGLGCSTHAWKRLLSEYDENLKTEDREWLELAQRLYEKHAPVFALVAYAVDPEYLGEKLTELEREYAANWVQEFYPECFSDYQKFTGLSIDHLNSLRKIFAEKNLEFWKGLLEFGIINAPFAAMGKILTNLVCSTYVDVSIKPEDFGPASDISDISDNDENS